MGKSETLSDGVFAMEQAMGTVDVVTRHVKVHSDEVVLEGELAVPEEAVGLVLFAHGSGSSRHSQRNRFVARELNDVGLATLLFDLLTEDEEAFDNQTREFRFDIPLLARRLNGAIDWCQQQPRFQDLKFGLFGASTGAAAALISAAHKKDRVAAVVSRGGRPDLADPFLELVEAPTLLIVGGDDHVVMGMNEEAASRMIAQHEIVIVPGATHLFEEPGKLEEVAHYACDWFSEYLQ